jgi:hypothetical protein
MEGTNKQRWMRALLLWVLAGAAVGAVVGAAGSQLLALLWNLEALGWELGSVVLFAALVGAITGAVTLISGLFGWVLMRTMAPDKLVRGVSVFALTGLIVGTLLGSFFGFGMLLIMIA